MKEKRICIDNVVNGDKLFRGSELVDIGDRRPEGAEERGKLHNARYAWSNKQM